MDRARTKPPNEDEGRRGGKGEGGENGAEDGAEATSMLAMGWTFS